MVDKTYYLFNRNIFDRSRFKVSILLSLGLLMLTGLMQAKADTKNFIENSSNANDERKVRDEKENEDSVQSKENKKHKGKEFKARGDAPCLAWIKPGLPVRAVLLCIHGLGLNSSSYEQLGKQISNLGVACYAIDVRGFGSWMQAKGHKNVDFKDCIQDVKGSLEWLRKSHPNKTIYLLGESMGGAIALQVAAEYPQLIDGLISACASGDRFKQKKMDLKVALHALLGPGRSMNIGDQIVNQATQNPNLKDNWTADPLNRLELSPMELWQFQNFMNDNYKEAQKIKDLPVLMVQGSKDGLVKPEGTEELFETIASSDKEIFMVPNAEHLIFEEGQCTPDVYRKLLAWMINHSRKRNLAKVSIPELLAKGQENFAKENYEVAISQLKAVLMQDPTNAQAHYLLGQALLKLNRYPLAHRHLVSAVRLGKGSEVSVAANQLLLNFPSNQEIMQNFKSRSSGTVSDINTNSSLDSSVSSNSSLKPKVIVFSSSWSKPCQDLQLIIDEAKKRFSTKVDFLSFDVDDPKNESLLSKYSIGPVPTTVFLSEEGKVSYIQVGNAGMSGMIRGMTKIIGPLKK